VFILIFDENRFFLAVDDDDDEGFDSDGGCGILVISFLVVDVFTIFKGDIRLLLKLESKLTTSF
jgi:hypothetical protein